MNLCAATQPHWGYPCGRAPHPPGTAHVATNPYTRNVITIWWDQ